MTMATPANRDDQGRFPKGVSGNPTGRPASLPGLERAIREKHGPNVMLVMDRLLEIALGDGRDAVTAAKLYLDRVLGPPVVRIDDLRSEPLDRLKQRARELLVELDGDREGTR